VNALELLRNLIKRFVPTDALPAVVSAAYGVSEPVLIKVNVLQGDGLRADVTPAERVVSVAADVQVPAIPDSDFDATYRFTEVAVAIMRGANVGVSHRAALNGFHFSMFTPFIRSQR
jgi:hypothetical protein